MGKLNALRYKSSNLNKISFFHPANIGSTIVFVAIEIPKMEKPKKKKQFSFERSIGNSKRL